MDTRLTPDGFFWIRDGVLSEEFCKGLIAKFEECPDKRPGKTLAGYEPERKASTDLFLTNHPSFTSEDRTFFECLSQNSQDYIQQLAHNPWKGNQEDTGYNMQRTEPGQQFVWHTDFSAECDRNRIRTATFIWYLNDIEEGGQTEFTNGISVQPKTGRLLMFPADFSVIHRGVSPVSQTKYIVTGWFWQAIRD